LLAIILVEVLFVYVMLDILAFVAAKLLVVKPVANAVTLTSVAAANTVTPVRITSDAEIAELIPAIDAVFPSTVADFL
jgi:hypothetical protein